MINIDKDEDNEILSKLRKPKQFLEGNNIYISYNFNKKI